jgi:hypothetical protein
MGKQRKLVSVLFSIILLLSTVSSILFMSPVFVMLAGANPGDVAENWYNASTLNVTVLWKEPRINWYDFQYLQGTTWVSKRDAQIDVNDSAEYRFVVNVSSDHGWSKVKYINISAWYDQGDELSIYNGTPGANFNLRFQYDNTTGTPVFRMNWPSTGEVREGTYHESWVRDPVGSPRFTQCENLTFSFIPGYQFRYAPGDGSWDTTLNASNDINSWNFLVTASDGTNWSSIHDEFGVYSYTEIMSVGWPTIYGNPGENISASSNITMVSRSNGEFSLSVDVGNLTHRNNPTARMSRELIWIRGGDLDTYTNLTAASGLLFFYGAVGVYHAARADGTTLLTDDLDYKCNIPLGQIAGEYTAPLYYHLSTVV